MESNFISRLQAFMEYSGINDNQMTVTAGLSNGLIGKAKSGGKGMSAANIEKILKAYPNLSPAWLLTGEGEMLRQSISCTCHSQEYPSSQTLDARSESITSVGMRPRLPLSAAAGTLSIATESVAESDCEQMPVIEAFPSYDFTIPIEGESMAPDYLPGDELACRFCTAENIRWGRPHVLDTSDGIIFKRIYDGGASILCRSINPKFKDFEVDKKDVLHVAEMVGFIRHID